MTIEKCECIKAQLLFSSTVGLTDVFKVVTVLTVKSASFSELDSYFSLRSEVSLLHSVFSTNSTVLADTVGHHGPPYPL